VTPSSFQLVGLRAEPFESFFDLPDAQLQRQGIRRVVADAAHGFPCRIGLQDAPVGADLLLLPFEHQPAASPYRASGPIYVRRGAQQRTLAPGEIPPYVSTRLISLRAYDSGDMMVAGEVREGTEVAAELERLFADARVRYVHLHNARRGCYSCLARRAA
jgi:hypothetical protein